MLALQNKLVQSKETDKVNLFRDAFNMLFEVTNPIMKKEVCVLNQVSWKSLAN